MASFSLPPINDNPDGGWGPSPSNIPEQFKFKDIPYAPYSKSDKLGRFADWNDTTGENRQATVGLPNTRDVRGAAGRSKREGVQAFGSGTASAFAYFHVEDESSFSLVDNKTAPPRRGGFTRGRASGRGNNSFNARGTQRGGRGGFNSRGSANQRGGRRGWRDWEKVRSCSTSIAQSIAHVSRFFHVS
jgi:translation initiation factor 3 subunit D